MTSSVDSAPLQVAREQFADTFGAAAATVHHLFTRALTKALMPHGLTARQFALLHQLTLQNGLNQAELAERLAIESQTIVKMIDGLENQGWVQRQPDPLDRRAKLIFLSPEDARWQQALRAFRELQLRLVADFSSEELAEFLRLHQKMTGALTCS